MSDLNETARATLRRAVLERRSDLRHAYAEVQELQRTLKNAQEVLKCHRDVIVDLQEAAGDPIEIDPAHPEIT